MASTLRRDERVARATSAALEYEAVGPLEALGVDAVELADFEREVEESGEAFLAQCFSRSELAHCAGDAEKLAARFALKEAALKALGTGMRGIGLHDVEVETAVSGEPRIRLSRPAAKIAAARGLGPLRCSVTREAGLVLAVVAAGTNAVRQESQ